MTDTRSDPDQLSARIRSEDERSGWGKLKIFFGATTGVVKTYAILSTAHQQAKNQRVLVGIVETHGHKDMPQKNIDVESWTSQLKAPWQFYARSILICAIAAVIAALLHPALALHNIAMLFLFAVVMVSVRYGLGPSLMASVVSVLVFDFFFVPPRFSFAVSDVQYLFTNAVILIVGLITAKLTMGLTHQKKIANRRAQKMKSLYEISRDLSSALMVDQVAEISQRFTKIEFEAQSMLLQVDDDGQVVFDQTNYLQVDLSIAQWSLAHAKEAGNGTDTLPGSPLWYIPLRSSMRTCGILVVDFPRTTRLKSLEQSRLLDIFAHLLVISLDRIHHVSAAQSSTVQIESERLRNSLLSALSHDLRTPLTALVGLTDELEMLPAPLTVKQKEIVILLREKAQKMSSQVSNLLEMARLQSGSVTLNRQWSPIEEVIGSAIRALQTDRVARDVKVMLPDDFPPLHFDSVLMERVFINLLENANKYTPEQSSITIGGSIITPQFVEIWVQDNGLGLTKDKEEDIFRKFERGDKEGTISGVGLGLTICRAIIEAHGGKITGKTMASGGARFTFSLPSGMPPKINFEDK